MEKRTKVILNWSGGQESAVSLFELKSPEYEVVGLLSVFGANDDRLQWSDLPRSLVEAQARSLELPLFEAFLPQQADGKTSDEEWMKAVSGCVEQAKKKTQVEALAFSDVHLIDIKKWRQDFCQRLGLEAVFPLWGWEPGLVHQAFFGLGHQGILHGLKSPPIRKEALGRAFNSHFVEQLPPDCDSLGSFGEFFNFVWDGPFFSEQILVELGRPYEKNGWSYVELKEKPQGRRAS